MFWGRGQKPEYLEKISWSRVNQQTRPLKTLIQESNPGHIIGTQGLSLLCQPCISCASKEINANNLLAWALCVVHRMHFLVGDLKNYYGPKVRAENLRTVLGSSLRTCNCQSWVACNLIVACFVADIVFFIALYQRWIYPIDPKRVNEFGTTGETLQSAAPVQQESKESTATENDSTAPKADVVSDKKND